MFHQTENSKYANKTTRVMTSQPTPISVLSIFVFRVLYSCRQVYAFCKIKCFPWHIVIHIIIYKGMFLGCDWLIRVQLIPNIIQNSAKICNRVQKSVTTVQKSVTTVQRSVTTVQKSVISSLSDGIYSQKPKIWRPNYFHVCLKISSKFQHNLGFAVFKNSLVLVYP